MIDLDAQSQPETSRLSIPGSTNKPNNHWSTQTETNDRDPSPYQQPGWCKQGAEDHTDPYADTLPGSKLTLAQLFEGPSGSAVMTFGCIVPLFLFCVVAFSCYERLTILLLKMPLETTIECILTAFVPVSNYVIWRSIKSQDVRFAMRRGILNGVTIGASTVFFLVSAAAIALGYPTVNRETGASYTTVFLYFSMATLLSTAVSVYLAHRLSTLREFRSARLRTNVYSCIGVLLSIVGLAGAEARSAAIAIAEDRAINGTATERKPALQLLRSIGADKELRMECSDPRANGVAGMFIKIDTSAKKQLYFLTTGKQFCYDKNCNYATLSDDYLRRHVVGAPIKGLSLVRSAITGLVNSDSLTSTISWTFVFKNKTYYDQEARAEFALPDGAVISEVTMWKKGEPQNSFAVRTGEAAKAYHSGSWIDTGHEVPTLVTDLGRGRNLLHCFPVPAQDELKLRLSVVAPLKLASRTEATVGLPRLTDSNFDIGTGHELRLRSWQPLKRLNLANVTSSESANGQHLLAGNWKYDDMLGAGLAVRIERNDAQSQMAAFDSHTNSYVIETITGRPTPLPSHLVVVIDGSQSMKEHLQELSTALQKIPRKVIPTSVIIASEIDGISPEPMTLDKAQEKLPKLTFSGGEDNLEAVVKAAELAGENKGGAVLWIHGAQPSFNQEIYIMSPYVSKPAFYELALDKGLTDSNELFRNHREIGPFVPIARNTSVKDDLERFLARWKPGNSEFSVDFSNTQQKPNCAIAVDQKAHELIVLRANAQVKTLLSQNKIGMASNCAVNYGLVTPVSGALIIPDSKQPDSIRTVEAPVPTSGDSFHSKTAAKSLTPAGAGSDGNCFPQKENPSDAVIEQKMSAYSVTTQLQGATNGTIGPQSQGAPIGSQSTDSFVMGVNTVGAVRVNNLANLESLLNIISNMLEIAGIVIGLSLIVTSFTRQTTIVLGMRMRSEMRLLIGITCLIGGIVFPMTVNWFVTCARDANLFS